MSKKANQALPYGRMYSPGLEGIASERVFARLVPSLGTSAASTYYSLRRYYGVPAHLALSRAREQRQKLGKHYQGGLDCVRYRVPNQA